MSGFGYSVGDIVLISRLAYRLYIAVKNSGKAATKDFNELGDALFSLHCALNHLSQTSNDIWAKASTRPDSESDDMRRNLNLIIDSCASTLNDLDVSTKKYRDTDLWTAKPNPNAASSSTGVTRQRTLERWRNLLKVQYARIEWDFKKVSLGEYRQKLQSHASAINIILSTFIWSTAERIETSNSHQAKKIEELHDKALESNKQLLDVVKEIHRMISSSKPGSIQRPPPPVPPSPNPIGFSWIQMSEQPNTPLGSVFESSNREPPTVMAYTAALDISQIDREADLARSDETSFKLPQQSQLPLRLKEINKQRQATGSEEFMRFQARYRVSKPPPKPAFLHHQIPAVQELRQGIDYIFRPYYSPTTGHDYANSGDRKQEIITWAHGVNNFLDFCISSRWLSTQSHAVLDKRKDESSNLVGLILHLNSSLESSDNKMKRVFYEAIEQSRFDQTLEKLQTVSRSVRCMKEIEEFEDAREEWMAHV